MSYEGYVTYLCVNGHENSYGCYEAEPSECEDCGAVIAWRCGTDQTNDSGVSPVLVQHKPAEYETCECCGHSKITQEEQFQIPTNAGHALVQLIEIKVTVGPVKFRDNDSGELFDTEEAAWANKGYC